MNKHKTYMLILVSVILAVIIYVSYGMMNTGKREKYHTVSVILDNSSSDQWNALRKGLEQGAQDYRIHLNVVSTGELFDLEEEYTLIGRELEQEVDGLIVDMCWTDKEEFWEQAASAKPIVFVQDNLQVGNVYTAVAPDPVQLGNALGEAILERENKETLKIGVLAGKKNRDVQTLRIQGLQGALLDSGCSIEWILYEEDLLYKDALEQKMEQKPIDVLAALDNEATEAAVDFLSENPDISLKLYGEARSEKAVYYLDKGLIEALVVSNDFYMGYRSVELMAQKLNYHLSDTQQESVDFFIVSRENMYEKSMEKILFPTIR